MLFKKVLILLIAMAPLIAGAQPWDKFYQYNLQPNVLFDFVFDSTKGGLLETGTTNSSPTFDIAVRINAQGDTIWTRKNNFLPDSIIGGLVSVVRLTNGDYIFTSLVDMYFNSSQIPGYAITRLDRNGNLLYHDSIYYTPFNTISGQPSIRPVAAKNSGYYLIYNLDTPYINSIYIDSMTSASIIDKYDSSNNLVWRKSFAYTFRYPPGTLLSSAIGINSYIQINYYPLLTQDDGLIYVKEYDTVISLNPIGSQLEKRDQNGNIDWTVNLNSLLNIGNCTTCGGTPLFCSSDSCIIAIFSTQFKQYILKFNATGNLVDSFSYGVYNTTTLRLDNSLGDCIETSNGNYLFSASALDTTTNTTFEGFKLYDKHFNYISFSPWLFSPYPNGVGKMIPNQYGGATTSSDPYRVINFDSSFNTYPSSVSGKLVLDNNNNCQTDPGDFRTRNSPIVFTNSSNQSWYAFSDDTGYYKGHIPFGSFNSSHTIYGNKVAECPAGNSFTYSFTSPTQYTNANFYDTLIPNIRDLSLDLFTACSFVPGFDNQVYIVANNPGTVTANPMLTFIKDPAIQFVSSTPAVSSVSGDTLRFNLNNLYADSSQYISITLHTPATVSMGAPLQFSANLPFSNDLNPSDNVDTLIDTVRNSYDPNDKTVNRPLYFDPNKEMVYSVEFQNTGTYYAKNIVVVDKIDPHLDLSTFHLLAASPFRPQISWWDGNTLMFRFENINLPDSAMSQTASIGRFAYSIRPKQSVQVGDTILNVANIFFDFNTAITTDTTMNIVAMPPSHVPSLNTSSDIQLYPNPSLGELNIALPKNSTGDWQLSITDISGRAVSSGIYAGNTIHLKLEAANGIYFVSMQNLLTQESYVRKLVLQW